MACKTLQSEDLGEDEIQPAPKLLEVILQNCRGRVDDYLPLYMQASMYHTYCCNYNDAVSSPYSCKMSNTASRSNGQKYAAWHWCHFCKDVGLSVLHGKVCACT